MKHFKIWMLLAAVPFTTMAQDLKGTDVVPLDPNVKTGKLKNGLTYFIQKNGKPENKVDLRLVINAGSILEDDDQQGLAHFMEHMCFNGTKRFPKNQLVDYLQSIGVKFGQHLNAYTSFDETVYFLPIPSDDAAKVEKGFEIIEDWAFNAVLTPEEIDKERAVVLEEYRIGLGADNRMRKRFMPKMMYQSHYVDRLPIGQKEILENFTPDKITRFYKDWYRPDLMAVIVVGDIDVAEMEKKVKEHFSSYENPKNERPRKIYEIPNHKETLVAIESDKEASGNQVQLMYKDHENSKPIVTVNDYRKKLTERLYASMLGKRLRELANSPTPPFTVGSTSHGGIVRTKDAYQSFAIAQEGEQLKALKTLVDENNRVKKYGFTQSELDRAKTEFLNYVEIAYNERDKSNSAQFVGQYQSYFLNKEPAPGMEWMNTAVKMLMPQITLTDINALVKGYINEDNRVVVITGPEKEGLKKVTEQEVLAVINSKSDDIKPYDEGVVATSLLRKDVKAGSIKKKENNAKLGTTTLVLSNGARVTYKKTEFKNDEVLFKAVSLGGSNLYTDAEAVNTSWASHGLTDAGFSGLKVNDINKFMSGKIAGVRPYVYDDSEGMSGSATPKDMEYMFQMIHAYFTDLNFDTEAYEGYKKKMISRYSSMLARPDSYFTNEFMKFLDAKDPRYTPAIPSAEDIEKSDYQLAYNKYKERFANAGDFEFFFVGNIDDKVMADFSAKYIASLPASDKREKATDLGIRSLRGEHKKVIYKGTEPKSKVLIRFRGDTKYDAKEDLAMQALGEILTIKLIEEVREKESGVYSISANGGMNKVPYGAYRFTISFPCGPENADRLTESALRELKKIIDNGPEAKDLAKYKEAELQDFKKSIKENDTWLDNMSNAYYNGDNPEDILLYENKVNALTLKDIQAVAKKYLSKDKIIGVLMPEKS